MQQQERADSPHAQERRRAADTLFNDGEDRVKSMMMGLMRQEQQQTERARNAEWEFVGGYQEEKNKRFGRGDDETSQGTDDEGPASQPTPSDGKPGASSFLASYNPLSFLYSLTCRTVMAATSVLSPTSTTTGSSQDHAGKPAAVSGPNTYEHPHGFEELSLDWHVVSRPPKVGENAFRAFRTSTLEYMCAELKRSPETASWSGARLEDVERELELRKAEEEENQDS